MSSESTATPVDSQEREFQFLIAKYLQNGPYPEIGQDFLRKLEEHKALPKRVDWCGNDHDVTISEMNDAYEHVESDYLLQVAKKVENILDEGNRSNNVEGVSSLLQSADGGRLDPLRNADESRKVQWSTKQLLYSRNPWIPRSVPHSILSAGAFPKWPQRLLARQVNGFLNQDLLCTKEYYSTFQQQKKILGHLAAVFNVIFDRTGKYLVTGSDDRLLKLWSAIDGRLLFTFRGHSAEVVIMTINDENTMLASVATDRTIRIWDLQSGAQIVVNKHTSNGFISCLKFSPSVRGNMRFLVASSMDGSILFWKYNATTLQFLPTEVLVNEKNQEYPDTKICSISFSSGGTFLASGSSDGFVRIYNLLADDGTGDGCPKKILQRRSHSDRVDSVEYCHVGDRVLTGSRDGTGRIWVSKNKEFTTIMLNSAQSLKIPGSERYDPRAFKRKVTMVGWSRNDEYAVLAADDNIMRVFDSYDGHLVFELVGHTDTVYVLESHPHDTNVYLSAGHDSKLILWSLIDGTMLSQFEQWIAGHGAAPFVDAKWSPDGNTIAATDMYGTLTIYGRGKGTMYSKTPEEQFFHTDYRPLMKDDSGFVIDEQTQLAPNLNQPPFLVSAAGVPFPPDFQRLVPGRQKITEQMQVPAEPLPALDAALNALNNQAMVPVIGGQAAVVNAPQAVGVQYHHPPDPHRRIYVPQPLNPLIDASLYRKHKELAILEIERHREHHAASKESPQKKAEPSLVFIAPPRMLAGEVVPVRGEGPVDGNHVAQGPQLGPQVLNDPDDSNDEDYQMDAAVMENSSDESEASDTDVSVASVEVRNISRRRNEAQPEPNGHGTRHSTRTLKRKRDDGTSPVEEAEDEPAENNASSSSKLLPRPRRKIKVDKGHRLGTKPSSGTKLNGVKKEPKRNWKPERVQIKEVPRLVAPEGVDVSPPKWLTETMPKHSPYFPQVDDVLYYYLEGHKQYVDAVKAAGSCAYLTTNVPWLLRNGDLNTVELVKVKDVAIIMKKPKYNRVAELTVERIGEIVPDNHRTIKIRYQEIPGQECFLILKQIVERSANFDWQPDQRVRSIFHEDNGMLWYKGTVLGAEIDPLCLDSTYHTIKVQWDGDLAGSEPELLSPWDLSPLDPDDEPDDGVPVTAEELEAQIYEPDESDWPHGRDETRIRVLNLLQLLMEERIAQDFTAPVDFSLYADYPMKVAYPVDLTTIRARLENNFYRHQAMLLFDISQIPKNSTLFNGPTHEVTMCAHIVAGIATEIINDVTFERSIRTAVFKHRKLVEARFKDANQNIPDAAENSLNGNIAVDESATSEEEVEDEDKDSEFSVHSGDFDGSDEEPEMEGFAEDAATPSTIVEEEDGSDDGTYGREPGPSRRSTRKILRKAPLASNGRHSNRVRNGGRNQAAYRDTSDESAITGNRRKASAASRRNSRPVASSSRANGSILRNGGRRVQRKRPTNGQGHRKSTSAGRRATQQRDSPPRTTRSGRNAVTNYADIERSDSDEEEPDVSYGSPAVSEEVTNSSASSSSNANAVSSRGRMIKKRVMT